MNRVLNARPPGWFWIVSVLALSWSAIGVYAFIRQVSGPAEAAGLPTGVQIFYDSLPGWVTAAFAIAVFGALLGCIGLVNRKTWARPLLIVSLVAVLLQDFWALVFANALSMMGTMVLGPTLLALAVAIFLVWVADRGVKRGWLR